MVYTFGHALRELHPSADNSVDAASAGVGALLALIMFYTEFDIIGMIGLILLIGNVMKNAIMMIDVAVEARR